MMTGFEEEVAKRRDEIHRAVRQEMFIACGFFLNPRSVGAKRLCRSYGAEANPLVMRIK